MENVRRRTRVLTHMALLLAISVALSALEHMLPPLMVAVPSVRLGLSNIVTMYALFFMGGKYAFGIAVLKSLFVLLMRGVTAGIMSAFGGVFSVLAMLILGLIFKDKISYLILSVTGAIVHNFAQIAAASIILESNLLLLYWPILLISGVVLGSVTGTILRYVMPYLGKIFKHTGNTK